MYALVWLFLHDILATFVLMHFNFLSRFVQEYSNEPWRGYGRNVVTVFDKLERSNFQDLYGPSNEQFDGNGSFGNGGAMRIVPMALFCHSRNCTDKQLVVCSSIAVVMFLLLRLFQNVDFLKRF